MRPSTIKDSDAISKPRAKPVTRRAEPHDTDLEALQTAGVSRIKGELFGADQKVCNAIIEAVMAHRLAPGTKLVEAVLAEMFKVPRTVVRMGLLRLAHDQIVELRPNRGAVIASPSMQQAREVYAARRLIEGGLVTQLCGELNKGQLAELKKMVSEGHQAYERDDIANWIKQAGEFHVRLAEFTDNAYLSNAVRELVARSNLITALYLTPGHTVFAKEPRLELIQQLGSKAPTAGKKARELMEKLLLSIENRLKLSNASPETPDLRTLLGY
jgi:DNA-binding GntR family transcriptional regulator